MVPTLLFLLVIGLIVAGILGHPVLVNWKRDRLKQRPFPALWLATVEQCLPMYSKLSPDERKRLQGHIQVFLAEKQFLGCGGLQMTPELKLRVATVACLLLLNERGTYFPKLRTILVYPSTYFVDENIAEGYVVAERRVARLGESWSTDQVVLAWDQVQHDTEHWQDGQNLILHEFAHQLDQEDGKAEGVPILPSDSAYTAWAKVMTAEYEQLCRDVEQGRPAIIDPYGATNPAEFFAVATETFMEKPNQLNQQHPALYAQLEQYYQLNPVEWA